MFSTYSGNIKNEMVSIYSLRMQLMKSMDFWSSRQIPGTSKSERNGLNPFTLCVLEILPEHFGNIEKCEISIPQKSKRIQFISPVLFSTDSGNRKSALFHSLKKMNIKQIESVWVQIRVQPDLWRKIAALETD